MKKALIITIFTLFLLIPLVSAANVHGKIYDIDLNTARNTIIKIDTTPEQIFVSKDGTYSFTVQEGEYLIKASYKLNNKFYTIEQEIKIKQDGNYILDLILLPSEQDIIDRGEDIQEYQSGVSIYWYLGIILVIIALFYIFYKRKPKKKQHIQEDDLPEKVIKYIKEQGGRTTQKDIRKKFPMSEAKISLVVTELEHKKIIKKIKKGRGNIIILN